MKKNYVSILMFAAIALTFSSCSEYPGYKKNDNGLFYKFYTKNKDAQKPEVGDVMTVEMCYKIKGEKKEKDSVLFSSKDAQTASKLMLVKPIYKGDISEGLAMMSVGDSASFLVNADSFFVKNVGIQKTPDFVKGHKLVFDVKLISFQKKADYDKEQKLKMEKIQAMMEERKTKEPDDIKKYLLDNKIKVKPTATGLYYVETKRGTGQKAANGKKVKVKYTGKLFDGTVFDSSEGKEPIEFTLGSKEVIPGWEEGILMMKEGGKATMVIPSSLAYSSNGAGNTIMPYTPLVFDVELVAVK